MTTAAQEMQAERERTNLANHRERLVWLSSDSPQWSCGEPVDAHSRNVLLLQSQAALATGSAQ